MVIAVSVGFVLAAVLFMRRMAEITEAKITLDYTEETGRPDLPRGVGYYEVNGPMFFGAAQSAMEALHATRGDTFRVLVLRLGKVSVIDATGFAALESAIESLLKRKKTVILAGPLPHPRSIFEKAKLDAKHEALLVAGDLDAALNMARQLLAGREDAAGRSAEQAATSA